ncbi:MAG: hypothetical protein ONB48_15600 [candidate division KSB1 bacterium]|nr:hypothetical protein [candidate division KSB1 bacterium]MDZ7276149.1 hypothetical protein [candidate division KSB1 bacterium]MDZ7287071.1 hypothetical protein [candidate division KSB1 bacterium]MDZ7297004.1 hypothetical protein [candidate division KSB1 bacterium]MDZ7307510.1 hypothetical protein [candidate division KSB1 bacterium]
MLAAVWALLEQAHINYALLRGLEELNQPGDREIDLLVAAAHLPRLREILPVAGFAALPAWGHAPHHFFLAYSPAAGTWLKLDVVTELRYGKPIRHLALDLAPDCLHHRQAQPPLYVLAPEDEFLTLLLHCLLDKAGFREVRRQRLHTLFARIIADATSRQRLARHVQNHLAPGLSWPQLERAASSDDWEALLARRRLLMRHLWCKQPLAATWRSFSNRLLQRLRPVLHARQQPGLTVALLAPDGAGKSTLAAALQRDFGLRAELLYMGGNVQASTVGLPTTGWLHRRQRAAARNWRLLLKPVVFVNRLLEQWYRFGYAHWQKWRGRVVVFDRFVYDAWVSRPAITLRQRLRRAVLNFGWPTPDLIILLDAPGELLYRRKGEHSPAWLEQQRRGYLSLQHRLPQMVVVEASQPAHEVQRQVTAIIWERCRQRQAQQKCSSPITV